jgi:hypothetical protein
MALRDALDEQLGHQRRRARRLHRAGDRDQRRQQHDHRPVDGGIDLPRRHRAQQHRGEHAQREGHRRRQQPGRRDRHRAGHDPGGGQRHAPVGDAQRALGQRHAAAFGGEFGQHLGRALHQQHVARAQGSVRSRRAGAAPRARRPAG